MRLIHHRRTNTFCHSAGECVILSNLARLLPALTLRQLALIIAFFLGLLAGSGPLFGTYDGWWHLAGGRYIVEHGRIPHTDPFSFTAAGQEWVMHEWAWDVIVFLLYAHWGPLAWSVLVSLVGGAIFVTMLHLALRRGAGPLVALAVVALASQAMSLWINDRPQVLQPLFILLALHLMHSYRRGRPRALLWYAVLMLFWVNFHGSFPVGLVLYVAFALCELVQVPPQGLRRALPRLTLRPVPFLAAVLLLCVLACLLNPNGTRGALYPLDYVGGKLAWATENVTEWKSPDWHHAYLRPLEAMLLMTVLGLALSPGSATPFDLLTLLIGIHGLLQWGRNGAVFATLASPILAVHWSAWLNAMLTRGTALESHLGCWVDFRPLVARLSAWALVIGLAVIAVRQFPWHGDLSRLMALQYYPVKACEVIALNNLQGNMWNVYHWGGYVLWRFYGQRKVFMDGRADVYGERIWNDYRQISQAGGSWKAVLDKWKVEYLLLDPDYAICRTIDLCPDFVRIYGDSRGCLYVRKRGVNRAVVEAFRAGKLVVPPDDLPNREALFMADRP